MGLKLDATVLFLGSTMKIISILFAISLFLFTKPSMADYIATGPISGIVCSGLVFKSCPPTRVDAVEGKDGKLYSLARSYPEVSEFNGRRCWIELKSGSNSRYGGRGLWDFVANMFGDSFYQQQSDGSYKKIDVERLMFDCKKTN
jgi:hypothetical protein